MIKTNLKVMGLTWSNHIKNSFQTRFGVCIEIYLQYRRNHTRVLLNVYSTINMQGYSIMHKSPHHHQLGHGSCLCGHEVGNLPSGKGYYTVAPANLLGPHGNHVSVVRAVEN